MNSLPTDPRPPPWQGYRHTHDVCYRGVVFPVHARVLDGTVVMYRADGLVEWVKLPGRTGWLYRGAAVGAVSIRTVATGAEPLPGYRTVERLPPGGTALGGLVSVPEDA